MGKPGESANKGKARFLKTCVRPALRKIAKIVKLATFGRNGDRSRRAFDEKAGKRGWPFYASTHINHTVPWWPLYKNLGNYIHRASAVLRFGHPVAEVAVYLPQADIYADNMMSELHLAMRLEEHLGREAMDGIQKAGYWFDYINDEALCSLGTIADGSLNIRENRYRVIILAGCTRLPVETAEKLRDFAKSGGILLCDGLPSEGCGLMNAQENANKVRELMAEAAPVVVENRREALISALHERFVPDVTVSAPDTVGYVHRADGDTHLYFLSNLSDEAKFVTASFKGRTGAARAWSVNHAQPVPLDGDGEERGFFMEAHGTVIVVFSDELEHAPMVTATPACLNECPLTGWTLTVDGRSFPMDEPVSWETLDGLKHYSGMGSYECTVDIAEGETNSVLCLTGLSAAARIFVNGEPAGDIWTHPLEIPLKGMLREGVNTVRIEAYSTLVNEMMTDGSYEVLPDVLPEWPYYGTVINIQRKARLNCLREFTEQKDVLKSGLWGRVSLRRE